MNICANCFQDEEIKQFIDSTSSEKGFCDYCKEESPIMNVEELIVDFTSHSSPLNHEADMIDLAKSKLLKEAISSDLSKPMRRFDTELEYIPTQFICEYIRYNTGADGIQFNSSLHKGGVNIVLFDPTKVECRGVELHQIIDIQITYECRS